MFSLSVRASIITIPRCPADTDPFNRADKVSKGSTPNLYTLSSKGGEQAKVFGSMLRTDYSGQMKNRGESTKQCRSFLANNATVSPSWDYCKR